MASADKFLHLKYTSKTKLLCKFKLSIEFPSKWGIICQNWLTLKEFGWWSPIWQRIFWKSRRLLRVEFLFWYYFFAYLCPPKLFSMAKCFQLIASRSKIHFRYCNFEGVIQVFTFCFSFPFCHRRFTQWSKNAKV